MSYAFRLAVFLFDRTICTWDVEKPTILCLRRIQEKRVCDRSSAAFNEQCNRVPNTSQIALITCVTGATSGARLGCRLTAGFPPSFDTTDRYSGEALVNPARKTSIIATEKKQYACCTFGPLFWSARTLPPSVKPRATVPLTTRRWRQIR